MLMTGKTMVNASATRKIFPWGGVIALSLACFLFAGCDSYDVVIQADSSEIVLAEGASPVVSFAAEEMNGVFERAFGKRLPVVKTPTAGRTSIFLGDCEESRAAGIDVSSLGLDAFVIQACGDRIFIAGRDDPNLDIASAVARGRVGDGERATLFGVYEFLERHVGARFYFPGEMGTLVPRLRSFRVPAGRVAVEPAFTVRDIYMQEDGPVPGETNAAHRASWKALDSCRLRMQTQSVPCCHGQRGFSVPERFNKTHPEYFALLKGENGVPKRAVTDRLRTEFDAQLCHTSGVWDEFYLDCKSYLSGEPAEVRGIRNGKGGFGWNRNFKGRFIDVMPQDSMKECLCEKCQAAYDKTAKNWASELIWGNTARLAHRLADDGFDCIVTQMAYSPHRDVPRCELPSNVWVMVAETGPWGEACPGEPESEIAEVRRWTEKLGHKIWMWTYPSKFGRKATPGAPDMAPRAWARYYKRTVPYSYGAFCEAEGEKAIFHYLNYYVFSRIAWNADVDVEAVLAEHFDRMFGAAAPEMSRFYAELEEKWTQSVLHLWHEGEYRKDFRVSSDVRLWKTVYTREILDGWSRLFDTAESKVSGDGESLSRVQFIRREFLDHMKSFSGRFLAESDPELGRRLYKAIPPEKNLFPPQTGPHHLVVTNAGGSAALNFPLKDRLKPGTRYRVSGVFRLKDVRPDAPKLDGGCWFDGYVGRWRWFPNNRVAVYSGTIDWTYKAYEFTTPAELKLKKKPFFGFVMRRAVGEAWIDCLALEELGPAEEKRR